jgi:two-component system chemotaxis response regulator CheB
MSTQPIVVIGTSTGGLAALTRILAGLPADFRGTVLIVMHIGRQESMLPELLARHSALPIRHAQDGDAIEPGRILVAPADRHLLIVPGKVRLSHGPKENFSRPAIDPLFRSAALTYRAQVIGMILSGKLDDGTVGLQAIKAYGGIAMVQDPAEAEVASMPLSAVDHVAVDYCLPLDGLAAMLVKLVAQWPDGNRSDVKTQTSATAMHSEAMQMENEFALSGITDVEMLDKFGKRSSLTCPECHGLLWEVEGTPQRYRCHTGHAYTERALSQAQDELTEEAIWGAVRALHEKHALMRRFAEQALAVNRMEAATEYQAAADLAARQSEALRKLVSSSD